MFQFTVVLFIYYCDQFVALEIRHSRRHCRVFQQSHGMKRCEQDYKKTFIWNQYEERLAILKTENIKICGWTTKLEEIKMQHVCISAMSAEYLQKNKFLISQGNVATCLRCGGYCCMGFVANFIRFPAVQKFWKSVKISQSYGEFKGGNFFETQCIYLLTEQVRLPIIGLW